MEFKDTKSIYQQIADRICDEIILGNLIEDERIPSVREYAAIVEVNANTVMKTYDYLQSIEVIYNKRGIGYFVAPDAKTLIIRMRKEKFLKDEIDYFFRQLYTIGTTADELTALYKQYCQQHQKPE